MEMKDLLTLIEAVSESDLTGLKYQEDGVKLHLTKKQDKVQVISAPAMPQADAVIQGPAANGPAVSAVEGPHAVEEAKEEPSGKVIESPLVGTFYSAPSEDADAFVAVGDTVKKGQTLAIIEAMKLMNEIESEYDGTVVEILAENGQAVEYGQPLFRVR